jgi:nucleoside-diphosphate-sugar epimerase
MRAVLIGGPGQIGRAAARALVAEGWDVVAVSRSGRLPDGLARLGVHAVSADREDDWALREAVGQGADVVVDAVAYTRTHGEQLNALAGLAGSLVVISSASVYADDEGRTLDEAKDLDTFPRLPVPIPETQPTARAGDESYSRRKVALEQTVLGGPVPATVLRPCAIHGPGSPLPRELHFVQRAVDGRRRVALASNGESRFHTTSVANLAELVRLAAARPADRVLNAGDPDPPTTLEICRAIGVALDHEFEPVLFGEHSSELPGIDSPWATPRPFVVDMSSAERELGYRPVTTYPEAVRETCAWLVGELECGRDWKGTYLEESLDYAAEDAALASRA